MILKYFLVVLTISLPNLPANGQAVPDIGNPSNDPVEEYVTAYTKAARLLNVDAKEGIAYANQALHYAKLTEDHEKIGKAAYLQGRVYSESGSSIEAFESYGIAVMSFENTGNKKLMLLSQWGMAWELYQLKAYTSSVEVLESIKVMIKEILSEDDYSRFLQDLGHSYYFSNRYAQAKDAYQEAYDGNSSSLELNRNLAKILNKQGEVDRSISLFKEVIDEAKAEENISLLASSYNDLGYIHITLAEYEMAQPILLEAKALLRNLNDQDKERLIVGLNLGNLFFLQSKYKEALTELDQVLVQIPAVSYPQLTYSGYELAIKIALLLNQTDKIADYQADQAKVVEHLSERNDALERTINELRGKQLLMEPKSHPIVSETTIKDYYWVWLFAVSMLALSLVLITFWLIRRNHTLKTQLEQSNQALSERHADFNKLSGNFVSLNNRLRKGMKD